MYLQQQKVSSSNNNSVEDEEVNAVVGVEIAAIRREILSGRKELYRFEGFLRLLKEERK